MIPLFALLFAVSSPASLQLKSEVSDETVAPVIEALQATKEPVQLIIDTPGGEVGAGLALVKAIEAHGNVTCIVDGEADSMGMVILQACQTRKMYAHSVLMAHEISFFTPPGLRLDRDTLHKLSTQQAAESTALTVRVCRRIQLPWDECRQRVRATYWLDFEEALAVKAVDEVLWK